MAREKKLDTVDTIPLRYEIKILCNGSCIWSHAADTIQCFENDFENLKFFKNKDMMVQLRNFNERKVVPLDDGFEINFDFSQKHT